MARSATPIVPTIITASSEATACSGLGRMRAWEANPRLIARGLANDIRRTFPASAKSTSRICGAGRFGRTVHRMPQIGEIERGVWLASGFGGHGLNNTAMAGELIARGIVEGDQTWRLFAPYELVWAGGVLGRWWRKAFTGARDRSSASNRKLPAIVRRARARAESQAIRHRSTHRRVLPILISQS